MGATCTQGSSAKLRVWSCSFVLAGAMALTLDDAAAVLAALGSGLLSLLPVVLVAALLAGWLTVHPLVPSALRALGRGSLRGVLIGSLAGTLTPICGLGVVPLISVLLRRGVALPTVMAFWVSSPVTDPAMLVVTAGVLGPSFAAAKTLAAFSMGLLAGGVTACLRTPGAGDACASGTYDEQPGGHDATGRWRRFFVASAESAELTLRWLVLALVLEVLMQHHLPPAWIEAAVGADNAWGVVVAALVAAPIYLDGYAALPLVRGLVDLGMGAGAALALLISGAALSLYSALAVWPLVSTRVFLLYVGLALAGAIACGWVAGFCGLTVGG